MAAHTCRYRQASSQPPAAPAFIPQALSRRQRKAKEAAIYASGSVVAAGPQSRSCRTTFVLEGDLGTAHNYQDPGLFLLGTGGQAEHLLLDCSGASISNVAAGQEPQLHIQG